MSINYFFSKKINIFQENTTIYQPNFTAKIPETSKNICYKFFPKIVAYSIPLVFSRLISEDLFANVVYSFFKNNGYTITKLGQWLASRPDIVGSKIQNRLSQLHHNVSLEKDDKNFLNEKLKHYLVSTKPDSIIEYDEKNSCFFSNGCNVLNILFNGKLDSKVTEEVDASIKDIVFLGSGCISTVYKGFYNDKEVVFKFLNQKIYYQMEKDINTIKKFFKLLKLDTQVIEHFEFDSRQQFSLIDEANNLITLKRNFKGFKNVLIPNVVFAKRDLLIEDYIELKKLNDLNNMNTDKLVYNIQHIICKMVLLDQFIHTDLHFGNLCLSKNVKDGIVILDAGLCKYLEGKEYANLIDLLYQLIIKRNLYNAANLLIDRNSENKNVLNKQNFSKKFVNILESSSDHGSKVNDIAKLLRKHTVKLDYTYGSLTTSLLCVDGLLKYLSESPYRSFNSIFVVHYVVLYLKNLINQK